jgi:hypothetical protein
MTDHLVRAAQARRRADEARIRAAGLRQRRFGRVPSTANSLQEELGIAQAHALDAMAHLLDSLESSALAHDRAAVRYTEQADKGDAMSSAYAAKAAKHRAGAIADRDRAKDFQKTFDLLLIANETS